MISTQIKQTFADKMIDQGVAECAEAHFAGDARKVRHALLKGQCEHCECLTKSLARQISEYLGQEDSRVEAVYQYGTLVIPEVAQVDASAPKAHTGIHLVARVERKSAALSALIETLKVVVADSLQALGCPNVTPNCYTLDIEMVDTRDIRECRGFGLLVNNPYLRSQQVWSRSGRPERPPVQETETSGPVRYALPDSFDLELIPEARLIDHALSIERLAPKDRVGLEHHLTQLKVTLIRRIISDQLRYINIAKQWFTIADLADIYQRRVGFGRIGGKSAGMLLAGRILGEVASEALKTSIQIPESFFLGSDLMYIFMSMNGLMHWNDQKYKTEDEIRAEYSQIKEEFVAGVFPPEIMVEFQSLLKRIGTRPVIVRSSSQLEDNLGTSFAGKYDSFFCPNQGTPKENLHAFVRAIASTFASTFKPEALLYRRSRGLQDYDERMSVLIQEVQGEKYGQYFLPFGAGVAFSRNLYRWAPQIRREDGFARLVWGLGTRAVERVGDDYPRLVALSHPALQPDDSPEAVRYYSQRYVDLIDLEQNEFKTLPVQDVITSAYPDIRFLVQIEQDGYFTTPRSRVMEADIPKLAITFDHLLQRTPFAPRLSEMLRLLEQHFLSPVDVEFTVHIPDPFAFPPEVKISLLQCRPQSSLKATYHVCLPENLSQEDVIFSSHFVVPQGHLQDIRYVIFVPPEKYYALPTVAARNELGRMIGRLNAQLTPKTFICIGPGRWGTTTADLGVLVSYADICNAGALVELSGRDVGPAPEPSLGTHFFQDLMEASIYPISVDLDKRDTIFNRSFFYDTSNSLLEHVDASIKLVDGLHLIDVAAFRPNHHLELIMDDEKGQAVAFLKLD